MKTFIRRFLLTAIVLLNTLSVFAQEPPNTQIQRTANAEDLQRVEALLSTMSDAEKVGQLFMVTLYGTGLSETGAALIQDYHPGAVALFNFNTDYEPASQVAALIDDMQTEATNSGAGIPLLIAADQEGGDVRRIVNDVTKFPDPLFLGAITQPDSIRHIGAMTGEELHVIGVNMNLAPIGDLFTRQDMFDKNRVLHRRTFGDDPERVGAAVALYSEGLSQSGVIAVVKHFPGHGGTPDSHLTLPEIDLDAETAYAQPLRSFQVAIEDGVPALMVGHLYYSALEPEPNLPASLSPTINRILREDFGFDGLLMTDAMDMAAIDAYHPISETALRAINAGMDMVVFGPHVSWETQRATMQRLLGAVESGELSQERLNQSVRRILTLKAEYGILDWQPADPESVTEQIDLEGSDAALLDSFLDAATVIRDESELLPLQDDESISIVYPGNAVQIYNTCRELAPDVHFFSYTASPLDNEFGQVGRLGIDYDKVVIFINNATKDPRQRDLVLVLPPEKTIVVLMNSPFDLEQFPAMSTYLAMYSDIPASRAAACRVLFGDHPATGRLPIAVGDFPSGTGVAIGAEFPDAP